MSEKQRYYRPKSPQQMSVGEMTGQFLKDHFDPEDSETLRNLDLRNEFMGIPYSDTTRQREPGYEETLYSIIGTPKGGMIEVDRDAGPYIIPDANDPYSHILVENGRRYRRTLGKDGSIIAQVPLEPEPTGSGNIDVDMNTLRRAVAQVSNPWY